MKNLILILFLGSLSLPQIAIGQETPPPLSQEQTILQTIEFEGNHLISTEELQKEVAPYLGITISPEQFPLISQEIQEKINKLYQTKGYIFSGAYVSSESETDPGTLVVTVKETGTLTQIEVEGLKRIPKSYITSRIEALISDPLNIKDLEFALQRLQNDPRFDVVKGELQRGVGDDLTLYINVVEAPAFKIGIEANNYNTYLVGENQLQTTASSLNLLGFGDSATFQGQHTDGSDQIYVDYQIPLNGLGGTLKLNYQEGNDVILIAPLNQYNIKQFSTAAAIRYNQPIYVDTNNEVSVFAGIEWRQNKSSVRGMPFSFTPEIQDATTQYTALSVGQTWINRTPNQVVAISNELRFGVDLFGATVLDTPSGIDGRYFIWRFNSQYIRSLSPELLFRVNFASQLTPDALFFGERLQIGGIYTVPGFPYNQFSGDNGYYGSVAWEYTLMNDKDWGQLRVIPYFSAGFVDNNKFVSPVPDTIASVTLGLDYRREPFYLRLDYAQPLTANVKEQNILLQFGVNLKF